MPEGVYLAADLADSKINLAELLDSVGLKEKAEENLLMARSYLCGSFP